MISSIAKVLQLVGNRARAIIHQLRHHLDLQKVLVCNRVKIKNTAISRHQDYQNHAGQPQPTLKVLQIVQVKF